MAVVKRHIYTTLFVSILLGNTAYAQKKNFVTRTIDWSYKIIQGDSAHPKKKYYFIIPLLAYKPETRVLLGVSMAHIFRPKQGDSLTRPSTVRLNLTYSQNHQYSARPFVDIFTKKNKFNIRGVYTFTDFVEYFWGIGINSRKEDKELYHFRMNKLNLKGAWQFLPHVYGGIQYNLEHMFSMSYDNRETGLLYNSIIAGNRGSLSSGAGFTLYFDNRNNIYSPSKGQFIEVSNCIYNEAIGSGYNFSNITLDARKYVPVWKGNVVAFELVSSMNSGNVPFRLLGTLGSDSYMRGYYNGRYRDLNSVAFQAELRQKVWGPLGFVVFGGAGSVARLPEKLTQNLKPNFGGGLRIMAIPREKMNIRIDYGIGVDGNSAVYITMGEAF